MRHWPWRAMVVALTRRALLLAIVMLGLVPAAAQLPDTAPTSELRLEVGDVEADANGTAVPVSVRLDLGPMVCHEASTFEVSLSWEGNHSSPHVVLEMDDEVHLEGSVGAGRQTMDGEANATLTVDRRASGAFGHEVRAYYSGDVPGGCTTNGGMPSAEAFAWINVTAEPDGVDASPSPTPEDDGEESPLPVALPLLAVAVLLAGKRRARS